MRQRSTERRDQRRAFWDGRISDLAAAKVDVVRRWLLISLFAAPLAVVWFALWVRHDSRIAVVGLIAIVLIWPWGCWMFAWRAARRAGLDTCRRYGVDAKNWRRLSSRSPDRFDAAMRDLDIDTADPANRRGLGVPYGTEPPTDQPSPKLRNRSSSSGR